MNLPQPHLRITADEPGHLLVLEHEKIALPGFGRGLVMGLVQVAGAAESEQWWRPRRIRADARKECRHRRRPDLAGPGAPGVHRSADVVGSPFACATSPPGKAPAPFGPETPPRRRRRAR
jgi:hypothetical protein